MRVINAMFSKNLGGIEQAFIDYTKALLLAGNQVLCITQPTAKINEKLREIDNQNLEISYISNKGKWDLFAKCKLAKATQQFKPNTIIAHGNRPTQLLRSAASKARTQLISVAHNYKIKPLLKADYIFSITQDLKNNLVGNNFSEEKIFIIPNMLEFNEQKIISKTLPKTPVIGVMARFVPKKGVDIFLKAAAALKANGINFKVIIAGDGNERRVLQKLRDDLRLNNHVKFIGWAKDKQKDFYDKIDVFCLPSHHEPFGIVLLEAMLNQKPIITTDSEGPIEILENNQDALIIPKGHAGEMAIAIEKIIKDKELAPKFIDNAYHNLKANYHISSVSKKIQASLAEICN